MSLVLAADDITPGMWVAIHSIHPILGRCPSTQSTLAHILQSILPVPPGVPLRVLEISLPFIACAILKPDGNEAGPIILDFRAVRVCQIKERFVHAISEYGRAHESASCEHVENE